MTTKPELLVAYAELRDALRDALEGLRECLPYVPDYFREKWDLDEYAAEAEVALAAAHATLEAAR